LREHTSPACDTLFFYANKLEGVGHSIGDLVGHMPGSVRSGQAVCLGLSPEIGFAFLVGSFAFALYGYFTRGGTWAWASAAPILSSMVFLLVEGWPYLRRVAISAHGVYSFPVEPVPFILVFLFALVWLFL
jgi:hypothetical protein